MTATERLNALASAWIGFMLRGLIDATLIFLIVGTLWLLSRKRISAQLSYGLFLLVLLKLTLPVPITLPADWLRRTPEAPAKRFARWAGAVETNHWLDPWGMPRPQAPESGTTARGLDPASPPARTENSAAAPLSIPAWLLIGWASIVVGLLASLVVRHLAMHLRLRGARRLEAGDLPVDLAALASRIGVRAPVRLVEVPWAGSPGVWGLFRPSVILPAGITLSVSRNGLTWVLLHELNHIRRRDSWVVLYQRLVQIVYFFHPAVWLANRMIDAQREYACDDAALALADVPRYDCGAGFLTIVERANAFPWTGCPSLGLTRSKSLIRSRLMRILDGRRPLQTRLSVGSAVILLVVAAVGLPRLNAREEPSKPPLSAPIPTKVPEAQEKAAVEPRLDPTRGLSGVVRDRDGTPMAQVGITQTQVGSEIDFSNGVLEDVPRADRQFAWTGADGRYQFAPRATKYGVFGYHEKGYARKSAGELAKSADLVLEPWGRVEGTVTVLGKPLADVPIRFTLDATDEHSMFYDYYEYDTRTDAQGRYAVEHVPAGVAHASTGTWFGKNPGPYGIVSSAWTLIKPGETLTLDIGGSGRPLVGTLHVSAGPPVNIGGGRLVLHTDAPPEPPKPSLKEMETWDFEKRVRSHLDPYRSPEGLARRLKQRIYSVQVQPDGTFRAVEVVPGTYTLSFWVGEDFEHPVANREVTVAPIPGGRTDVPLDVGTVQVRP